jgi:hypothetical protein
MILGIDYSILASLLVVVILYLLFRYRYVVKSFFTSDDQFEIFQLNLLNILKENYPNIDFDITLLVDTKKEYQSHERRVLIVENIIDQFINYKPNFLSSFSQIPHNMLWDNYVVNSKPIKNKLPIDWIKRKEAIYFRDMHRCKRCGLKVKLEDANITQLKSSKDGGDFSIENLFTLCRDCTKIENSTNIQNTKKNLEITDKLYAIV